MWQYYQQSGVIKQNGVFVNVGYSGHEDGVNNPDKQDLIAVGPIPRGTYTIMVAQTHKTLGPLAMFLSPDPGNQMHGRSQFWIHGENPAHPGYSSDGCIILNQPTRLKISQSADRKLTVL